MKKLNKKGFTLIEGLIAVFVLVLVVGLGFYAKNRMDDKASKAESRNWNKRTLYCTYTKCYLRPGPGKAERIRWVSVSEFGYQVCRETGLIYSTTKTRPNSSTLVYCLKV